QVRKGLQFEHRRAARRAAAGTAAVREKLRRLAIPASTYRLQFHSGFTFEAAIEIVDYLQELGISHCYAAPIFTARKGSNHGYDVCSFEKVNPDLGGRTQLLKLARKLAQRNMNLVLDIVPNHM